MCRYEKDLKKTFSSRLDRAKSSISSSGSRNVDNYRMLSSLLEEVGLDSDVVPSTTSPAQRKPMPKHSGNGGSDVHTMVYCSVVSRSQTHPTASEGKGLVN